MADPVKCVQIRQQEQSARKAIVANPVKMDSIKAEVSCCLPANWSLLCVQVEHSHTGSCMHSVTSNFILHEHIGEILVSQSADLQI